LDGGRTSTREYSDRLERLETAAWKRWLDVQRPYRWHLRSLRLGFTLDLGCGRGRNLVNLGGPSAGVGVDHNADAISAARVRGLEAYLPDGFKTSPHARAGRFDSMLVSHVVEHMEPPEAAALVGAYLPYVRDGGQVVLITPQEAGYRSDETHVSFTDLDALQELAHKLGLEVVRRYSFPLPRPLGRVFVHNEFVMRARVRRGGPP
jgi:SAM-dependent methyltransferase